MISDKRLKQLYNYFKHQYRYRHGFDTQFNLDVASALYELMFDRQYMHNVVENETYFAKKYLESTALTPIGGYQCPLQQKSS